MSSRNHLRWYWIMLWTMVVLGLPAGCSDEDSPVAPDTQSDIRIGEMEIGGNRLSKEQIQDTVIDVLSGESVELKVWVVKGDPGTPVEGATVAFSEFPSNLSASSFSKTEELSDATGWATVTYTPSVAEGIVNLKIKAGSDIDYPELRVSSTPSNSVNLSVQAEGGATSIPADGNSSLALTITATQGVTATPVANAAMTLVAGDKFIDVDGNGVFSAGDQVSPSGDLDGDGEWDAEGSIPEQVTTDLSGKATFLYRAGENQGNVYIKVTMEGATLDYAIFQHPTSVQVTAQAGARELLADGVSQTRIEAQVSDWGGGGIGGVIVRFVAGESFTDVNEDGYFTPGIDSYVDANSNGQWDTIGSIESVATSDASGFANATYTAGTEAGPISIRVSTSSGSSEMTLDLVEVPPAWSINLLTDATTLPADGISQTTGTIMVRDVNGALVSGKQIRLVAGEKFEDNNKDGVYTPGIDNLVDSDNDNDWSAIGSIPATVVTNVDGTATFQYTAGLDSGSTWIRASADGVSVDSEVVLSNLPTAWRIELSSSESGLSVEGAGGVDNTIITASAFDAQNRPVPAGVPIAFEIVGGPGGGEEIQGAVGGVYATRTNMNGQATCILGSGTAPGLINVEATSGTTARQLSVVVGAGQAATLSGRSLDEEIEFWAETELEVFVQDSFGNPVADGTAVEFSVDEGAVVTTEVAGISRTEGGMATATYRSLGPSESTDYVAVISVSVPGTTAQTSFEVPLIAPTSVVIQSLSIFSSRTEVSVQGSGGTEEAAISVQAFDSQGRAVGSGFAIDFSVVEGPSGGESLNSAGWGPITLLTNAEGQATAIFRSGDLSGPVEIQAQYEDLTTTVHVGMAAADVGGVECRADSTSLVPGNTSTVWAFVYDSNHNAVPDGTVVWFSADEGLIDGNEGGGTSVTQDGIASATFTATPNTDIGDGTVEIEVEASGAEVCRTFIEVTRAPSQLTNVLLNSVRAEIGVRGTGEVEQTVIRAQGVDGYGVPVGAGIPVTFSIVAGPEGGESFLASDGPVTVETNASGTASVTLVAGTVSGTIVVQAESGGVTSDHASIAVAAGPPANIYMGAAECNVLASRRINVENDVVILVADQYNNPVRDNTVVYMTTDYGVVRGDNTGGLGSDVTVAGVAGGQWLSNGYGGIVTLTASTSGGTLSTTTSFIASDDPFSAEILSPSTDVPIEIAADGESDFVVWAEVLDFNGMFVLPAELFWETEFGEVTESDPSADGCGSSVARGVYKSKTLEQDFSVTTPDDGIGAVDVLNVSTGYGGVSDQLTVHLTTGRSNSDESKVELGGSAFAGSSVNFLVEIKDRNGNPLGGHTVEVSVSDGSITIGGATDSYGQIAGTFNAPADPGQVFMTVVDTDPNYGGLILTELIDVQ